MGHREESGEEGYEWAIGRRLGRKNMGGHREETGEEGYEWAFTRWTKLHQFNSYILITFDLEVCS